MDNTFDHGWRILAVSRANPAWGEPFRMERLGAKVTLVDEVDRAQGDVLFDRPCADPMLVAQLEALEDRAREATLEFPRHRRVWPDWLGLVQRGGSRHWDSFVPFAGPLSLVDELFLEVLGQADGGRGSWSTAELPLFDKRWRRVDTHRALVVAEHLPRGTTGEDANEVFLDAEQIPSDQRAPAIAWIGTTRLLAVSPRAARAFQHADIEGLRLEPVLVVGQ